MNKASKGLSCIFVCLLGLSAGPAWGQSWWNSAWSARRMVVVEPQAQNLPDANGAWVTMLTGGLAKSDGSDIRVTTWDGRPVRYWVLSAGPGDLVRVAFESHSKQKQRVVVYYGNPKAEAEKNMWRPEGGILLETWKYAGGPIGDAERIKSTVKTCQDSPPVGRVYLPSIFIGGNIFGPEEPVCNRYSGKLRCPTTGEYTFVISCFDAGALYVDDRLAVSWPGRHHWVPDIRHQGKIELKAGEHEFRLDHVKLSNEGGIVAAWSTPISRTIRILEAGHFIPVGRGQIGIQEKYHRELVADFTLQQTANAVLDADGEVPFYRYAFTAVEPSARKDLEYLWDFGDGQTEIGARADHVFLHEGLKAVKLTVRRGGKNDTTTHRVYIGPNRLNSRMGPVRLAEFSPIISRYRFSQIPIADVRSFMDYFTVIGQPGKAIEAGRAAVLGGSALPENRGIYASMALKTADMMINETADFAGAARILEQAARRVERPTPVYRGIAARAAIHYINALGDDKKTEELLKSCVGQSTQPGQTLDRMVCIAWGDVFRFRGDRGLAEQFYRRAGAQAADGDQEFPRSGGYVTAVEDYLRRHEFAEARRLLDRWQDEIPMERLGGYSCLLQYRWLTARKQTDQAKLYAKIIQGIDPYGVYARQMEKEEKAAFLPK